jgi:hypothetical protein
MVEVEFAKRREGRRPKPAAAGFVAGGGRAPRGQSLASLAASSLGAGFYSWRGFSGRNYVCSVFADAERAVVAEFSAATIIGVASEGAARRPVCVLSSREFSVLSADRHGEFPGVDEWHVHFGADEAELRDLAASLLS